MLVILTPMSFWYWNDDCLYVCCVQFCSMFQFFFRLPTYKNFKISFQFFVLFFSLSLSSSYFLTFYLSLLIVIYMYNIHVIMIFEKITRSKNSKNSNISLLINQNFKSLNISLLINDNDLLN